MYTLSSHELVEPLHGLTWPELTPEYLADFCDELQVITVVHLTPLLTLCSFLCAPVHSICIEYQV